MFYRYDAKVRETERSLYLYTQKCRQLGWDNSELRQQLITTAFERDALSDKENQLSVRLHNLETRYAICLGNSSLCNKPCVTMPCMKD